MKFIKLAALIFLITSTGLFAQDINNAPSETKSSDKQESAVNREKLNYQFTVGFGDEYGSIDGVTASAGYFLTPKDLILLRYSNSNSARDEKVVTTLRAVTLGYRHFVGNSFNMMPTLYYRKSTADFVKEGGIVVTGPKNINYEGIGAGFRIGNEWQWENFTMGCDWVGVNVALKSYHNEFQSTGSLEDNDLVDGKRATTVTLLSFYLGMSF